MSQLFRPLRYNQTEFPFDAAGAILRRRSVPKWTKRAAVFVWVILFFAIFILIISHYGDKPGVDRIIADRIIAVCIAASFLAFFLLGKASSKFIYRSFATAPYRSGSRTLELDEAGFKITSLHAKWHYPWEHIFDVIDGPKSAVMILLGPFEYEPISANAFADSAEQASFVAIAKNQLVLSRTATK